MKNQHNSHKNMMSTKDEAYRYMENRCKGNNKTRKDLFEF